MRAMATPPGGKKGAAKGATGIYSRKDRLPVPLSHFSATGGAFTPRVLAESGLRISSFAQDREGELYAVDYRGGLRRFTSAPARSR